MDPSALPPPPDPGLPDHPVSIPPVKSRNFLADRLLSVNGLISLCMLSWSALILRRPGLAKDTWARLGQRFPWLFSTRDG